MDHREDGQRFRVEITEVIQDPKLDQSLILSSIKFKCSINGDIFQQIIAYNNLMALFKKIQSKLYYGSSSILQPMKLPSILRSPTGKVLNTI